MDQILYRPVGLGGWGGGYIYTHTIIFLNWLKMTENVKVPYAGLNPTAISSPE